MGKISKALDKYASERKSSAPQPLLAASPLTHDDIIALVAYDEKTGHLLTSDPATGDVDERRIEALRADGTVLRLLENQLIHPGGKLTARGIEEARRLAAVAAAIPRRPAAPDAVRDRLLREIEDSADRAIPSESEPEPKGGPAPAPTAPLSRSKSSSRSTRLRRVPRPSSPRRRLRQGRCKVVPEPKPAAATPAATLPSQRLRPRSPTARGSRRCGMKPPSTATWWR